MDEQEVEVTYRWVSATGIWQFMCFATGVPLNSLVLYIWYRYCRPATQTQSRIARQTKNHWFLASMTLADWITCSFYAPSVGYWYVFDHQYSPEYCRSLIAIGQSSMMASSLNLLSLNVDKFLYLTCSLKYELYVTHRRALATTTIIWTLSILWSTVFVTKLLIVQEGCAYELVDTISYTIFCVAFFILPTSLSLMISIRIAITVSRYIGTLKRPDSVRSRQIHLGDQQPTEPLHRPQNRPAKRVAFIFATTIWTAITCLPHRCLIMVGSHVGMEEYTPLRFIFFGAMAANAVGNPLITLITLKSYRKTTKNLLKNVC